MFHLGVDGFDALTVRDFALLRSTVDAARNAGNPDRPGQTTGKVNIEM